MSQRADVVRQPFRRRQMEEPRPRWKRLSIPPDMCSSDIPTGTINAKFPPLSRHRTPGRIDIGRPRPFRRTAQGSSPQHRARARRFRGPDELAARCRYSHEERLQRHARRKSAHFARRRRRCHQTGAREAGRQDRSGRPLMGRRSSSRKQGTIPRFRRWFMSPRSRPTSENLWRRCPKPARRPKAATLFIPTTRATSTSTQGVSFGGRG